MNQEINLQQLKVEELKQWHAHFLAQIGSVELQKQVILQNLVLVTQFLEKKMEEEKKNQVPLNLPKLKKLELPKLNQ